jgi:hypothetical protein
MNNTEYYEYEGVLYRRIKLNDEWKWYKRTERYNPRMKMYNKVWESFKPSEQMEKVYLRAKKLERILGEDFED